MSISSWFPWRLGRLHKSRTRPSRAPASRRGSRLACEQLEDRTVPANYAATNADQLIALINTINQTAEADTIELVAGMTYTLSRAYTTDRGPTGLPTIAADGGPLTIFGNGATIERSTASGTPAFRLFDVAAGASLTLANVTLTGGLAYGTGAAAEGGAIYSSGSLTLEAGTLISGNKAAFGGGVYVAGGTATLANVTLSFNTAQGDAGYYQEGYTDWYGYWHPGMYTTPGGSAGGGGLSVAGGTVTINSAGTVYLDAFTLKHTKSNKPDQIDGSYILI